MFIGSFNFDPRSARLNTEMGFVIDSPALAQAIADAFADIVPRSAYEVRLGRDGALQWVEQGPDGEVVHDREPGTSVWRRLAVWVSRCCRSNGCCDAAAIAPDKLTSGIGMRTTDRMADFIGAQLQAH